MIQRLKAELETKELFRIGRKAENEVEQFDFDFTTWQRKYGEGSAVLLVQRNRDDSAYPVPLIIENGIASWVITDTDTAKSGRGTFQLEYVSGAKKKKSDVWHFICGVSLEGTLPAPDPYENWLETITEKTAEVSGYAQNAQQSAQDAYQSAEDAEASASSAQSSADNANQSAIDAENSADEAASHANEAKGYRDEAKTYRDEAENAESDVSDLVAEARGYADDANRYQSQASGYADNASASATQASISATNAEASATASANSASEADASADRAEQAKEDILASRPNWEESDSESLSFISNKPSIASGTGNGSVIEGSITGANANEASGGYSHAEGTNTKAQGDNSHAEGGNTIASGNYSHAEGADTTASGYFAHAEGSIAVASGPISHAEGSNTIASAKAQHVQGKFNIEDSLGKYAHIVGNGNYSARSNAHTVDWSGNAWYSGTVTADGTPTNDNDLVSKKWVEDKGYLTEQAQANWTESDNTSASYIQNKPSIMSGTGYLSIAEGYGTTSSGLAAHSEGMACTASDSGSHAEGRQTEANGKNSHAEGYKTIASGNDSHVQGKFNVEDSDNIYAHIVGNGDSDSTRSNAHTLDWSGNAWYAGKVTAEGIPTEDNDLVPKSYVDGTLTDYVKNTDYATKTQAGIIRIGSGLVISPDNKAVSTSPSTASLVKEGTEVFRPITPRHQHESTFYGLAKASGDTSQSVSNNDVGNYTDEAKASIQSMLGVPSVNKLLNAFPTDTATGSVASFSDGAELPLKELTVGIDPVQDLHGYDNPWPSGGGANLWGSTKMVNDILTAIPNYSDVDYTTGRVTIIPGSGMSGVALTNDVNFKENTQYTFIIGANSENPGDIMFAYSDGTTDRDLNKVFAIGANVSASGKTVTGIVGRYYSGVLRMPFEASGLFEGVLTADQFTPYSNICPISGWTESNVVACGKNLLDKSKRTVLASNLLWGSDSATAHANGSFWLNAGTYTFTCSETMQGLYVNDAEQTIAVAYTKTFLTFTLTKRTPIKLLVYKSGGTTEVMQNIDCWLTVGSTVSEYEPYHGTPITIDFGQTVYGGVLDVLSGKLSINRLLYKGGWEKYSENENYNMYRQNFALASQTPKHMSNVIGKFGAFASSTVSENIIQPPSSTGVRGFMALRKDLSADDVEYSFVMATPIEITLDPHEVSSLLGQNNIYADTGDTSVEYRADPTLYISKKIAEAISALS